MAKCRLLPHKAGWVRAYVNQPSVVPVCRAEITGKFATGEAKWTDPGVVQGFAKHKEWVDKGYFKKGEAGLRVCRIYHAIYKRRSGIDV